MVARGPPQAGSGSLSLSAAPLSRPGMWLKLWQGPEVLPHLARVDSLLFSDYTETRGDLFQAEPQTGLAGPSRPALPC